MNRSKKPGVDVPSWFKPEEKRSTEEPWKPSWFNSKKDRSWVRVGAVVGVALLLFVCLFLGVSSVRTPEELSRKEQVTPQPTPIPTPRLIVLPGCKPAAAKRCQLEPPSVKSFDWGEPPRIGEGLGEILKPEPSPLPSDTKTGLLDVIILFIIVWGIVRVLQARWGS